MFAEYEEYGVEDCRISPIAGPYLLNGVFPTMSGGIYWGGADNVMCLGTAKIQDLVDLCLSSPRPPMGPG